MRPRYNWVCNTCGAPAGQHCRSLTTNRVTDTHKDRLSWDRLSWVGILGNGQYDDDKTQ